MAKKRTEKEIVLEAITLGRGNQEAKKKLAKELGCSYRSLLYRVNKFKQEGIVGRKERNDKGTVKKDIELKTKLEFWAEMAIGTPADQITRKLGLSEFDALKLMKEFQKVDRWKSLKQAPQLDDLRELVHSLLRYDIAILLAEGQGSVTFDIGGTKVSLDTQALEDLKIVLASCMQKDEMTKVDPKLASFTVEDRINMRVQYLKEYFLERHNATDFARLERATKPKDDLRKIDLELMYAVIERFNPGLDEKSKINLIREEAAKLKLVG